MYMYVQLWSELLAPLVNVIKDGCENESALLILLIFYLFFNHKNVTFHWIKRILNLGVCGGRGMAVMEIMKISEDCYENEY